MGLDLTVRGNSGIANLDGLSRVLFIGMNLYIEDNPALTTIMGLYNAEFDGIWSLYINRNPTLPSCQVCDLLAGIEIGPAAIDVEDNKPDSCWDGSPLDCP